MVTMAKLVSRQRLGYLVDQPRCFKWSLVEGYFRQASPHLHSTANSVDICVLSEIAYSMAISPAVSSSDCSLDTVQPAIGTMQSCHADIGIGKVKKLR